MSDLGNTGGILGGVVAILIALKPYIIPSRHKEHLKVDDKSAGAQSADIWRLWIKEDCKAAVKEELLRVIGEIHDKQDEIFTEVAELKMQGEREIAIARDIRTGTDAIRQQLAELKGLVQSRNSA